MSNVLDEIAFGILNRFSLSRRTVTLLYDSNGVVDVTNEKIPPGKCTFSAKCLCDELGIRPELVVKDNPSNYTNPFLETAFQQIIEYRRKIS